ncbi:MAG: hypothetical protein AAF211_21875 [Myxococcota bacterium]
MRSALKASFVLAAILFVALVSSPALGGIFWGNPIGVHTPVPDATVGTTQVDSVTVTCPGASPVVHTYGYDVDLLDGLDLPSIDQDCEEIQLDFDAYTISGVTNGAAWSIRILDETVVLTPDADSVELEWELVSGSPDVVPTMEVTY